MTVHSSTQRAERAVRDEPPSEILDAPVHVAGGEGGPGVWRIYEAIFDASADGIALIDPKGRYLAQNAAHERMLGYSMAELEGHTPALHMGQVQFDRVVDALARTGEFRGELQSQTKDGRTLDVELRAASIRDANGRLVAHVGIKRDISARRQAEGRLAVEHVTTRILSESKTVDEACHRILEAVGATLNWSVGAYWLVDDETQELRCHGFWAAENVDAQHFEAASRSIGFAKGVGFPGRIWRDAYSHWIPDVATDPNFPRAPFAGQDGLRSGLGFPILLGGKVLGTLEFFHREMREPDQELLQMFDAIGRQVGQFVERRRAEAQVVQRYEQLRALHALTEAGARAQSPQQMYEEAMTAVQRALGADRAAVVLYEEDGVMRFKASRNLAAPLAAALERHSQAKRDDPNPKHLWASDVNEASEWATLRPLLRQEGIRTLGFVPLAHGDRLLGRLMLGYDQPRVLAPDEVQLAQTIAGSLAFAIARRRSLDALYHSEERFHAVFNQLSVGIALCDLTGRFVMVNDRFCHLVGRSPGELRALGVVDVTHPEDWPQDQWLLQRLADEGTPFVVEKRLHRRDRSTVWVQSTVSAVRDADQRPTMSVHVTQDVTDRRGAEEVRSLLAALVDSSGDAILSKSLDGEIRSWNPAAERIFGYSAEEAIGQPVAMLVPPHLRDEEAAVLDRLRKGERAEHFESQRRRKDGTIIDVSLTISPIFELGGRVVAASTIARDITDRKRAEEEIQRGQRELKDFMENSVIGLNSVGPDGTVLWANEAQLVMLGLDRPDYVGHPLAEFHVDDPAIRSLLERLFRGESVHNFETRVRCQDGSIKHVLMDANGLVEQGQVRQVRCFTLDITKRKQAEEQLEAYRNQLEELIQERTRALVLANREMEAFTYSVSHDLRAPLRTIDGFSRLLETHAGPRLDEEERRLLFRVHEGVKRMANLIDDLLTLSRLTRSELRRDTVNLSDVAGGVVGTLRLRDPSRNLETRIAPGLTTRGDPHLLNLALQNLLENAWKFTGRRNPALIEFGADQRDGQLVYFVRDNGAGFDMAHAGKLFQPFQRLHGSQEFEGTGVGLATVQRIVQRHGGHVWAEGQVEQGATFYFTLGPYRGAA